MKVNKFKKFYPWLPGVACEVVAAVLSIVYSAIYGAEVIIFLELLGAALLPFVVPIISLFLKKPLPTALAWALAAFVIMAVGLGTCMGLYAAIPWWDLLLHALSGLLCSVTIFILIIRWGGAKLAPAGCMVIIAVFTLGISGLWEIIEYITDAITGNDAQKVAESLAAGKAGTADSMEDMLISLVGVAVFYIMLAVDKKFGYKLFGYLADFHGFEKGSATTCENCLSQNNSATQNGESENDGQYSKSNGDTEGENVVNEGGQNTCKAEEVTTIN